MNLRIAVKFRNYRSELYYASDEMTMGPMKIDIKCSMQSTDILCTYLACCICSYMMMMMICFADDFEFCPIS